MVGQSTGEPSGGRSHALDLHNRPNPSPPDDALRVPPRCPAVRCHIEDVDGSADTQALYPGGRLLLPLDEGVGDEVGHLEQVVGVGASERGASHDSRYGDVLCPLAVVPRLLPAGRGVAAPEPAVEAEPPEARSIASWATTRTTPRTSSPSLALATVCRRGTWEGEYPVSALQLEPANRGITFVAKVSRFLRVLLNGIPMCVNSTSR